MNKKIAVNHKMVTSVELDCRVVRIYFSDIDYVADTYETEKDAANKYNEFVKEFGLYKFI